MQGIAELEDLKQAIGLGDVLVRLKNSLDQSGITLKQAFSSLDKDRSGFLDIEELADLLRQLFPALTSRSAPPGSLPGHAS